MSDRLWRTFVLCGICIVWSPVLVWGETPHQQYSPKQPGPITRFWRSLHWKPFSKLICPTTPSHHRLPCYPRSHYWLPGYYVHKAYTEQPKYAQYAPKYVRSQQRKQAEMKPPRAILQSPEFLPPTTPISSNSMTILQVSGEANSGFLVPANYSQPAINVESAYRPPN